MPTPEIPLPTPWLSWLPSEYSSQVIGVKELWLEGLGRNAGTGLVDMTTVLSDRWGVDLESQVDQLLELVAAPVLEWVEDAAAAALGIIGLGSIAIPVAGWIVSGLAALGSAILKALGARRDPPPSPIQWAPPVYRQAVDQDAVRVLLALTDATDWQEAMRAPEKYFAEPAPDPDTPSEPMGGSITPVGGGVLQPGGVADAGWYVWSPPHDTPSSRPGGRGWTYAPIVDVATPSVRTQQRQLWAALLGDLGIVWAVDAVALAQDWERAGASLVTSAKLHAAKMGLAGPWLDRNEGPFLLAEDATPEQRERWQGRPCLVETMPFTSQPFPEQAPIWKGGPMPFARVSDLAGYRDTIKRHAWLPRTAVQACVALDALAARQEQLTKSRAAAWALPSQPGAAARWEAIAETRAGLLQQPQLVEAARVRDPEYRQAVEAAQAKAPTFGGVDPAAFEPGPIANLPAAIPGDVGPLASAPTRGGGGALAILVGALALGWSRRRR